MSAIQLAIFIITDDESVMSMARAPMWLSNPEPTEAVRVPDIIVELGNTARIWSHIQRCRSVVKPMFGGLPVWILPPDNPGGDT